MKAMEQWKIIVSTKDAHIILTKSYQVLVVFADYSGSSMRETGRQNLLPPPSRHRVKGLKTRIQVQVSVPGLGVKRCSWGNVFVNNLSIMNVMKLRLAYGSTERD